MMQAIKIKCIRVQRYGNFSFNPNKVFDLAIKYLTDNEEEWNPISNGQL